MKKILFLGLLASFLFAFDWSGKVHWVQNYQTALKLAKKEHKLVMIDLSLSDCPPCRYIAEILYNNPQISGYINKHFEPVFYLVNKDRIPYGVAQYFTGITPTLLFIAPNGKMFYRMIGARPPQIFLNTLQTINESFQKNEKVSGVAAEPKTVQY